MKTLTTPLRVCVFCYVKDVEGDPAKTVVDGSASMVHSCDTCGKEGTGTFEVSTTCA